METLLLGCGRIAAGAGVLICIVAIVARLTGRFFLGTMQVGSVLQGGMAALLVASVCLLLVLTKGAQTGR